MLQVLFYRSGTKDPGLVGLAEVCRDPYPDHTSWDDKSKAYDPKSTPDNPRWFMVDIQASLLTTQICIGVSLQASYRLWKWCQCS